MKTITKAQTGKGKKKATSTAQRHEEHIQLLKKEVGRNFAKWRVANPKATLAELLRFLEVAHAELSTFDEEQDVEEFRDDLYFADQYLAEWGQPDEEDSPITAGYRADCVLDDIESVSELIEKLSGSYRVSRLPKWKPKSK